MYSWIISWRECKHGWNANELKQQRLFIVQELRSWLDNPIDPAYGQNDNRRDVRLTVTTIIFTVWYLDLEVN